MLPKLLWLKEDSYSTTCQQSNSKKQFKALLLHNEPITASHHTSRNSHKSLTNDICREALCVLGQILCLKIEVKSNVSWETIYVELTFFSLMVFTLPTDLNFSLAPWLIAWLNALSFIPLSEIKKKTQNKQQTISDYLPEIVPKLLILSSFTYICMWAVLLLRIWETWW